MIKYLSFIFALVFFTLPLTAEVKAEIKISAFLPTSSTVRHICSEAIPFYEVEISKPFGCSWEAFFGIGYASQNGSALGCGSRTRFSMVPLTLGVKYFWSFKSCMDFYTGAGLVYSFFQSKDHSPYVHKNISNRGCGAVFKLGLITYVRKKTFVDLFAEYLYQPFSFHHHYEKHYTLRRHLDMGGIKIGAALGLDF